MKTINTTISYQGISDRNEQLLSEESLRDSNGKQQDNSTSLYFRDLKLHHLLTREQEISIAREIDVYRKEYMRLILETPFGLEAAINLLDDSNSERISIDQILYSSRKARNERRLKIKLSKNIQQICKIVEKLESQNPDPTSALREKLTKIYKLPIKKRKELQQLVEGLPLQIRYFTGFEDFKGIETILEERKNLSPTRLCESAEEYQKRLEQIKEVRINYENAKNKMAEGNLKLVVSIARKYSNKGVDFKDLIAEGNFGLMKAVERYDVEKGFKFSTYSIWWIKRTIKRALDYQQGVIKTPINRVLKKTIAELASMYGRRPTIEEIATKLRKTEEDVMKILKASSVSSLDEDIGFDEDSSFGDLIEDVSTQKPEEGAELNLLKTYVLSLLDGLKPREKEIIELRYGICDGNTFTLQEIGDKFGVSREMIRHIEQKALKKLIIIARFNYL